MGLFEFFDWLWIVATITWAGAPVVMIALAVWAARVAWSRYRLLRRMSQELALLEDWPPITSRAAHAEALARLANAMRRDSEDR